MDVGTAMVTGSVTEKSSLQVLTERIERIHRLLQEPECGSVTWNIALARDLAELVKWVEWWLDGE